MPMYEDDEWLDKRLESPFWVENLEVFHSDNSAASGIQISILYFLYLNKENLRVYQVLRPKMGGILLETY